MAIARRSGGAALDDLERLNSMLSRALGATRGRVPSTQQWQRIRKAVLALLAVVMQQMRTGVLRQALGVSAARRVQVAAGIGRARETIRQSRSPVDLQETLARISRLVGTLRSEEVGAANLTPLAASPTRPARLSGKKAFAKKAKKKVVATSRGVTSKRNVAGKSLVRVGRGPAARIRRGDFEELVGGLRDTTHVYSAADRDDAVSHPPAPNFAERTAPLLPRTPTRRRNVADRPAPRRAKKKVSRPLNTTSPKHAARYANTTLMDSRGKRIAKTTSLRPRQQVRIRLGIGQLAADSDVEPGPAFPDKEMHGDVTIDILVSSTDFAVGGEKGAQWDSVAHGQLALPGNGGPARALDGSSFVTFRLSVPPRGPVAHLRIGFYFRNTLLQSQQLTAYIGRPGGFRIVTDFTVSNTLTGLERIPERPRLSVLTNDNQGGVHQIVIRAVDPSSGVPSAGTFQVNDTTVGATIRQIRNVLTAQAPTTRRRRQRELISDLKALAMHGWTLFTQLAAQQLELLGPLYKAPADFVVQVVRPTSSGFVVPWALIYEIPISDNPAMCPMVANWRDGEPLFQGMPRSCPHGPHQENVLCPFGFWGFRYAIEQLSSSDAPVLTLNASPTSSMVVAETQFDVDLAALKRHVDALRASLVTRLPRAQLREGTNKETIRKLLGDDLPLVYFYCHGQSTNVADPNTWLAVGKNEIMTAKDVIGWILQWQRVDKVVWNKVRPLVFINACHSLAVYPTTLVSYLDAFVGAARAAGVIGTEVQVNSVLACEFAEKFFDLLLNHSHTVDSALRTLRLDYLAGGNLLGLVYTPYCWADLRVVTA